jgi:hypothetical protein
VLQSENSGSTLWWCQNSDIENGPVEIVSCPIKNGDFPSFFVCLPEGTPCFDVDDMIMTSILHFFGGTVVMDRHWGLVSTPSKTRRGNEELALLFLWGNSLEVGDYQNNQLLSWNSQICLMCESVLSFWPPSWKGLKLQHGHINSAAVPGVCETTQFPVPM